MVKLYAEITKRSGNWIIMFGLALEQKSWIVLLLWRSLCWCACINTCRRSGNVSMNNLQKCRSMQWLKVAITCIRTSTVHGVIKLSFFAKYLNLYRLLLFAAARQRSSRNTTRSNAWWLWWLIYDYYWRPAGMCHAFIVYA